MAREQELTKMVCIRLKPETVDALQARAESEHRTLSQYVRIMLENVAEAGSKKRK